MSEEIRILLKSISNRDQVLSASRRAFQKLDRECKRAIYYSLRKILDKEKDNFEMQKLSIEKLDRALQKVNIEEDINSFISSYRYEEGSLVLNSHALSLLSDLIPHSNPNSININLHSNFQQSPSPSPSPPGNSGTTIVKEGSSTDLLFHQLSSPSGTTTNPPSLSRNNSLSSTGSSGSHESTSHEKEKKKSSRPSFSSFTGHHRDKDKDKDKEKEKEKEKEREREKEKEKDAFASPPPSSSSNRNNLPSSLSNVTPSNISSLVIPLPTEEFNKHISTLFAATYPVTPTSFSSSSSETGAGVGEEGSGSEGPFRSSLLSADEGPVIGEKANDDVTVQSGQSLMQSSRKVGDETDKDPYTQRFATNRKFSTNANDVRSLSKQEVTLIASDPILHESVEWLCNNVRYAKGREAFVAELNQFRSKQVSLHVSLLPCFV
jgi:hypothetical protein